MKFRTGPSTRGGFAMPANGPVAGACSGGRGGDTVGNPHRPQISRFELFELILLLKLGKRFPVERFEAAVSQSAVPSPPLTCGGAQAEACGEGTITNALSNTQTPVASTYMLLQYSVLSYDMISYSIVQQVIIQYMPLTVFTLVYSILCKVMLRYVMLYDITLQYNTLYHIIYQPRSADPVREGSDDRRFEPTGPSRSEERPGYA